MAQVFNPVSIDELIAYSTVRIITETGSGTGFLFNRHIDDQTNTPVVITNKHVIEGAYTARIVFHLAKNGKPSGELLTVEITDCQKQFIGHNSEDIDLCAMHISSLIEKIWKSRQEIFIKCIPEHIIPNNEQLEELSYSEPIIMIGYPNGLIDEVNNYPIFRRGFTATHPSIDYEAKKEFLIDAACFPGSSGSPIFLLDTSGLYCDKQRNIHLGSRYYFLGVLYAGPVISLEGEITIHNIPTAYGLISQTENMLHLGFVIKSSEVIHLMNQIS